MLEARLNLIERIRKVEHALAHAEQARVAASLMRGRAHDLGNAVQIVKLSSLELQRRLRELSRTDLDELITDMHTASDHATRVLADMIDATHPLDRAALGTNERLPVLGPVVSHTIRAAVEAARPAFLGHLELRIELDDTVHTRANSEELEAIVIAATLDAISATRITFILRERLIQSKRWVELLRIDDRQVHDGDYAEMFDTCSLLRVVSGCAKAAGGEVSLSPGRGGLELAVEMPVALMR